jgi:hypothetical protein
MYANKEGFVKKDPVLAISYSRSHTGFNYNAFCWLHPQHVCPDAHPLPYQNPSYNANRGSNIDGDLHSDPNRKSNTYISTTTYHATLKARG